MTRAQAAVLALAVLLAACSSTGSRRGPSVIPPNEDYAPTPDEIPDGVAETPDAVPTPEPRSRGGNAKTYTVFGKTYRVMSSAQGFKERGHASWYGKKFHGRKTANGELYDIYGMTAAHKTLPLPTFVRVTNLSNNKTAIVRVNDRGPFHGDRIIDLSYAAAAKLDIIGHGTAQVEIEALDGREPQVPAEPASPENAEMSPVARSGYLQVASYADAINAVALREDLRQNGVRAVEIRIHEDHTPPQHTVVVGPFETEAEAEIALEALSARGLTAVWIEE